MKSFYVLTAPAATDPDRDTIFIRDGFSWLAFLFPLPWMLIRRLWMAAIVAVALYVVSIVAAEQYGLDAAPIACSFLISLWVALEGGLARVRKTERLGWQVERVLAAETIADAEAIHFAEKAATARSRPAEPLPVLPAGKPVAPSSNIAALGLIGPQGGR
ncbi:MAG: DUF2628 domain-containing protein [Rhizobium sp.]|nr:DUF2628 domain-containing protein [Rhizobium sp.]